MGEAGSLISRAQNFSCEGDGAVVRVSDFRKLYGKKLAVSGVTLDIQKGMIHGLIGPDGAGKSTLMKAIAGVLSYDAGEVEVFGVPVVSEQSAERVKPHIGFMPQGLGLNLYPDLSVEENIDFFARLRLVPAHDLAARKQRLLAITRLEKFRDRAMKNLSGGMKQKLGLVCTLIHQPALIILDEPTTGVDPVSRRDFWTILADLLKEGNVTALISTAYMDEASRFNQISMLYQGQVMASGKPESILALIPGSTVRLRAIPQIQAVARLGAEFSQVDPFGDELRVFVEDGSGEAAIQRVRELLTGIEVSEITASEPDLDNVFLELLLRREQSQGRSAPLPSGAPPELETERSIAIEARGLVRDFGKFRAVDNASFRVPQGEIFGLLGANGAGKTTVIKMLTGILQPTDGEGWVAGANLHSVGRGIKEHIGYMSQAFSLYRDLSVRENIRLYAGIYGLSRREMKARAEWIIAMADLSGRETELAGRLPMGLVQRLALGCALVHRPRILFLDEPTSGVDPLGRQRFWDILFQLSREERVAILITTHYMSEAERCDHLALMSAGKVIADGSPAELKAAVEKAAGKTLEIRTDRPVATLEQLLEKGFEDAALFGNKVHLLSSKPEADEQSVRTILSGAGIETHSIRTQPLSMEDVFIYRVTQVEKQQLARQEEATQ
ncbi:MAG: ABC transporter ATP-binding protein [Acidobacteria bacterium]|nr:MAG: ABC transporter ATP-binding protein [Acidobacteriota bacterium]